MRVALTFDDGPNPPCTNQILEILRKAKIKAIFFVCGANAKKYPSLVKKIARDRHLVGNHTFNHSRVRTLLGTNFREIIETQKLIESLTGQTEKLFRPPHGYMPFWLKNQLIKNGFKIIYWNIDTKDWEKDTTVKNMVNRVIFAARDNSIVLLHNGVENRSATVKALGEIIHKLRRKDFKFVFPNDLDSDLQR